MSTTPETLRAIVRWMDWQNEYFNERFKTAEDIVKAYNFCREKEIEFLDNLADYMTTEEYEPIRAELNALLGYVVI